MFLSYYYTKNIKYNQINVCVLQCLLYQTSFVPMMSSRNTAFEKIYSLDIIIKNLWILLRTTGFTLGCKAIKLFPEADLEVLLHLVTHELLQLFLWPAEVPLNLLQGRGQPAVEFLEGSDPITFTAAFGEVVEVLLLQWLIQSDF